MGWSSIDITSMTLLTDCRMIVIESVEHFLLQFPNYTHYRTTLFNNLSQIYFTILEYFYLIKIFLFGSKEFNLISNKTILNSVINFIIQ